MRKILELKLKIIAKLVLKKYKPEIVGITGSVGKSSAKEAIYKVLSSSMNVRTSIKNYNNEVGLPLSILGFETAGKSLSGWLKIFIKSLKLLLVKDKDYPKVLILEMGIDRPGDMDYLLSIAPVNVGVATAVSYSHVEHFGSIDNIKKEKQKLIQAVNPQGLSIVNHDNEYTKAMKEKSRARVMTFGLSEEANLKAQDIVYNYTKDDYELAGIHFKLDNNGSIVPVTMDNVMAETVLYAALAAAAVGIYFKMNLVEIAQALKDFSLPKGRMNFLPGVKHSFIIDDTYNAAPKSAIAGLETLGKIKIDERASRWAILGDMLEIGHYTEEGHRLVGENAVKNKVDYLIAVGERARDIVRGAVDSGMDKDKAFHFDRAEEAGKFLEDRMQAGDVILVKGSQGVRMEKVVKEIMAEPQRAEELLVRQGKEWKDK